MIPDTVRNLPVVVSIVVAARNARRLLTGLLESFRDLPAEARDACEVIIVDAASVDGTAAWLLEVAGSSHCPLVRWISEPDTGIADAWNKGVSRARGKWVMFLGADDRVADGPAFAAAITRLATIPSETVAVAFPVELAGPDGGVVASCKPTLGGRQSAFFQVNTLPHQGVFHRRRAWDLHGPFDTRYSLAADYEFLLRLAVAGESIVIEDVAPPVRMALGGASKRHPHRVLREFRRAQGAHGIRGWRWSWWRSWITASARRTAAALCGEAFSDQAADWLRVVCGSPRAWTAVNRMGGVR